MGGQPPRRPAKVQGAELKSRGCARLAIDAVVEVVDPAFPLQDPGSLEVLRAGAVEEAPPSTEKKQYEVDLELVDEAGGEGELNRQHCAPWAYLFVLPLAVNQGEFID